MRIIDNWQYRYIEKSLYDYYKLADSKLDTEKKMKKAIEAALAFFHGTSHEVMMRKFYFEADNQKRKYTNAGHFNACCNKLHIEGQTGYLMRREIIYRVCMGCYAEDIFTLNFHK